VIAGATNATTTVSVGPTPKAVAVNPVSNKIYVTNFLSAGLTVIDGATNTTSTVSAGSEPSAATVNPVTNQIYVANFLSNTVTVIDEQQVQPIPLLAEIAALAGNVTSGFTPAFNFTAESNFAPFAPNPDNLLFQVDTWQGPWMAATAQGNGAFSGQTAALQPGVHILYAYSTDGQDATSTMGAHRTQEPAS
jgi:YVTN family beta-propeller protein